MNSKAQAKVEELRGKGINIWSISRLNSFNNCKYGYHETYNNRNRGKANIYSFAGTELHEVLEDIHNNKATMDDLKKIYDGVISKSKAFGIKFPNEQIENNWRKDMEHFVANFKKLDYDIITEKQFIIELVDGIWLQGFIDAMYKDENGDLVILDWKTSSKFTGDKKVDAGRQLLLYKLAVEEMTGEKVGKIAWHMMKYVYVTYNGRDKMCSRRKWVDESKANIKKALKKHGGDDFVNEMLLEKAIELNSLEGLPQEVQDQFKVRDCTLYYEATDEAVAECKEYIVETVNKIKQTEEWIPVDINKGTEFFCKILCNHRETCKYLKAYNSNDTCIETDKVAHLMSLFN